MVGVRDGCGVASTIRARYIGDDIYIKVNTFMGRPQGRIHSTLFQMRASTPFLKSVDNWRAAQDDNPSRAEAVRRLVELGLTIGSKDPLPSHGQKLRAREMAGKAIDRMTDATAHPHDQASRKQRLLKGPEEFREARVDRPKGEKMISHGAKRPWTPEEEGRLRALVDSGVSLALVAVRLKRTITAIRGRASILKLPLKQPGLKAKGK